MASFSNSGKDDKSGKEVVIVADDEQSDHSTTIDILSEIKIRIPRPGPGRLHKVPKQMQLNKEHIYAPRVLPLGPYHHDEENFHEAEQFKSEVLNIKLDENGQAHARGEFLKHAQEIRNFYGGLRGYPYDDNALAEMMLRDACTAVYLLESLDFDYEESEKLASHINRRFGTSGGIFMYRDFIMLENQVPFWAIKLLIRMTLSKGDGDDDNHVEEFLRKCVTSLTKLTFGREFWDPFVAGGVRLWGDGNEQEPLHLLALFRRKCYFGTTEEQ